MSPQTKREEKEKKEGATAPRKVVTRSTYSWLKQILLALGSFASMVFGTFLIVFGVLDWALGPIPPNVLTIFPARGFGPSGVQDPLFIIAGIGLWILGLIGVSKSIRQRNQKIGSLGDRVIKR